MMYLIVGLIALYAALLLTIYYVPLRSAIEVYPDVPESAASVPDQHQPEQERDPSEQEREEVGSV